MIMSYCEVLIKVALQFHLGDRKEGRGHNTSHYQPKHCVESEGQGCIVSIRVVVEYIEQVERRNTEQVCC